jgi:formylglycine-generating enzyme required for sulfatase activity
VSEAPRLDDAQAARAAGATWLSVALMDARNRTLRWLHRFESTGRLHAAQTPAAFSSVSASASETAPRLPEPWHLIGRAGWYQEHWVARYVQRARGAVADPCSPRLASVEPRADAWFDPRRRQPGPADGIAGAEAPPAPSADALRAYLAATLETTLELLEAADPTDAGLHVYRLALRHEDRLSERLAVLAQWLGVAPAPDDHLGASPLAQTPREPLWIPARRFRPGAPADAAGFVPLAELGGQEESVPEFEIDAQAVSWERFVPFAEDGGYDDRRWWSEEGWAWLQVGARRAPRGVAQWRGGVVVERFGRLVRVPAGEAAAHVSFHEAQAWCRWAGRRLPAEVEWELAAASAGSRGYAWGDVREWAAGRARLWPGAQGRQVAGCVPPDPARGARVLRGASSWTVPRDRQRSGRVFVDPGRDELFCGFRSCGE